MVYRCYTEEKPGFDVEADMLLTELREIFGVAGAKSLRIINRYDTEGIDEKVFLSSLGIVFSEPQTDDCFLENSEKADKIYNNTSDYLLAVEALPGQFDQRADSCAQCIQMLAGGARPTVAYAKLYIFGGEISSDDREIITSRLINPVESRRADLSKPETLIRSYENPKRIHIIAGFREFDDDTLIKTRESYGLAMDLDDLRFIRDWFGEHERRDPTETELRVTDTYWSDHCRHTTFNTHLDEIIIENPTVGESYSQYVAAREEVYGEAAKTRPQTLMDIGTIAAKTLKKRGLLKNLDISEEVNACSIHADVNIGGETEDWLLMFKNETHNHPTEIEPFGGAATCIGGAIRDPLSGRVYVHQAMRVTGSADPRAPVSDTIPGKLPQRRITTGAAAGYSSYGNQIGLATGLVHELYHPGYAAKRMEVGAVIGAAPAKNIIRDTPEPGDMVILLGGRTGRDGIGGATGSSKAHDGSSLTEMASEVQKGNAPEERKIQRLFRKPEITRLIRRCNDFGAGGVSVAIGELADGISINLSEVRKKYDGLTGTELAISESQERMAVVVRKTDADAFISAAAEENLEAYIVAEITEKPRMTMLLDGEIICDLSREFLSSNGAVKKAKVFADIPCGSSISGSDSNIKDTQNSPLARLAELLSDLRFCSQRGLAERFDATVGAGSVLAPFGGKTQRSPAQAMAALFPHPNAAACSVMAFEFDPYRSETDCHGAARDAVVTSAAKLVSSGCDHKNIYLSFQEYFEKLGDDPKRWGKPFSALLGAFSAQMQLGLAAIGGKDSMSGSFLDLDVPPTLISFAVAPCEASQIISPEFKSPNSFLYLFASKYDTIKSCWRSFSELAKDGKILSARAITAGGAIMAAFYMSLGNEIGFELDGEISSEELFAFIPGGILLEASDQIDNRFAKYLGKTISAPEIIIHGESKKISELQKIWEKPLEGIFPTIAHQNNREKIVPISDTRKPIITAREKFARPRAVIPVFPGTNCEYDTLSAVERAGGSASPVVIRNLSPETLADSAIRLVDEIKRSQMIIIPGGFSGGDEPDGSGKFIASFFRNHAVTDAVRELLFKRDGLILGICNGFQALIKLGLVPYGDIIDTDDTCPTLTHNAIGRHQSKYVNTRICSRLSPWLSLCEVGQTYNIAMSHGEGRFIASEEILETLIKNGQIATQYCGFDGIPSMDTDINPNGSALCIEGITSPDGRVFGKMGHTERSGKYIGVNIIGEKYQPVFDGGVGYYK